MDEQGAAPSSTEPVAEAADVGANPMAAQVDIAMPISEAGTTAAGESSTNADSQSSPPSSAPTGDLPNVAASPAVAEPESAIASSAPIAPPVVDIVAAAPASAAQSQAEFAAATLPAALTGAVHPAHTFADRIHSLAFSLEGSGDSMLSRMGGEIKSLVAQIKSLL